jgi:hypothetical protein
MIAAHFRAGGARARRRVLPALVAVGLGLAGGNAAAQEVPPTSEVALRAAIRAGTCTDPVPDPVVELGALGITQIRPIVGAGPPEEDVQDERPDVLGEEWDEVLPGTAEVPLPPEILGLETAAEATPTELFAAPHAVVVSRVGAAEDAVVACGEVPESAADGDATVVGLRPLGGSNYYGHAVIDPGAPGETVGEAGEIGVAIYLFQGLTTVRGAPPAGATPAP